MVDKSENGNKETEEGLDKVLKTTTEENGSIEQLAKETNLPAEFIRKTSAFMFSGRLPNPLADKIEPKHIDKILENVEKEDQREYKYANKRKNHETFYIVLFVLFMIFLIWFLAKDSPEIFDKILDIGVGFIGGIGGGYYLRSRKN